MAKATQEVSVIDRLKALDEERTSLLDAAKSELLSKATQAIDNLNALGFSYRLTQSAGAGSAKTGEGRKGTRQIDPSKPCSICGFQTNPAHDARAHRSQSKKAPFTEAELKEKGMKQTGYPSA